MGQREGAEEKCCSRSARDVFCRLQVVPSSVVLAAGVSFDTKDLGTWNMAAVREAIPLPLDLVRKLEQTFLEVEGEGRVILGAILLPFQLEVQTL